MIEKVDTPAIAATYKLIKSIVHIAVSFRLILMHIVQHQRISTENRKDLHLIQRQLTRHLGRQDRKVYPEIGVIPEILNLVLKTSLSPNIKEIPHILSEYSNKLDPMEVELMKKATDIQLKGLGQVTGCWIGKHDIDLKFTRMLIACSKGPRKKNVEIQFFESLFSHYGIHDYKEYLMCIEMLPEQLSSVCCEDLIHFYKKQKYNEIIGEILLNNKQAMNEDVLGKYAPPILENMFCPYQQKKSLE